MKQVYMCEHCGTIGTEEVLKEHEKTCLHNPDARICQNCKHWKNLELERRIEELRNQPEGQGFIMAYNLTCDEIYRCEMKLTDNTDNALYVNEPFPTECDKFEKRETPHTYFKGRIKISNTGY